MLQVLFVIWSANNTEGRTGYDSSGNKIRPKPSSMKSRLQHVRRIMRRAGYPMVPVGQLRAVLQGLEKKFVEDYGVKALQRRARLPLNREMICAILGVPEGSRLGDFMVGEPTSIVWKAIVCTAASTGFRSDEVTGERHKAHIGGNRGLLSFQIQGRIYENPERLLLLSLRTGDSAILTPVPSKADRVNKHFGNKPIYLFFDRTDPMNACRALAQMELAFPSHGYSREQLPLFPFKSIHTPWSEDDVRKTFKTSLSLACPDRQDQLYSFHSFRIYLACALQKLGYSHAQIQAYVRWRSKKSVVIYETLGREQYEKTIKLANSAVVDSLVVPALPIICEADAMEIAEESLRGLED